MRDLIRRFLTDRFPIFGRGPAVEELTDGIMDLIRTFEFTALYLDRHPHSSHSGMCSSTDFQLLRNDMSKLTDAMTALGQQIAALNPAANAAHLQAIDDHLTKIDTEEGADEATLADTNAGLQALLDAATPAATGTPAPTTAPGA